MPDGRYSGKTGSFSRDEFSRDAELAEIRAELRNQGSDIATLVKKIDVMAESVTSMSVQMGHLVTKESCAEGRAALAQDLKSRMDSKRDITGVDLPIKDLVKHYVKQGKSTLTPIPYKSKSLSSSSSHRAIKEEKKEHGFAFWIGLISGLLAIIGAIYAFVVFVDRTLQRQERTEQILLQMQQEIVKNSDDVPRKQLPAKEN